MWKDGIGIGSKSGEMTDIGNSARKWEIAFQLFTYNVALAN
jgi:hypothetical protein